MILEVDNWYLGYSQILRDCRGGAVSEYNNDNDDGGSVWIFCSPTTDSLAAARILSYMFRNDSVSYHLHACWNFQDLQQSLLLTTTTTLRAVVLLNMGAHYNLTQLFHKDLLQPDRTKVYVMDCRRPFHLANIHAGNNVVVFSDGIGVDEEEMPSDGDNLSGNEDTTEEEDNLLDDTDDDDDDDDSHNNEDMDEDEGEVEFGLQEEQQQLEPRHSEDDSDSHYDAEDEQETINDDDDDNSDNEQQQQQQQQRPHDSNNNQENEPPANPQDPTSPSDNDNTKPPPSLTPHELHVHRRNRIRAYYNTGSFYGSPAAFISYKLASQLRFGDTADLLWLACVGVTDAFLHARLDFTGYTALAMQLKDHCLRLYPNDTFHRVSNTVYAEHLRDQENNNDNNNNTLTKIAVSNNGTIVAQPDFRFFLLRHSSLWDAMRLSDYCSTHLQLTKGTYRLQELLAQMGFPLTECQQPFSFMKQSLKRSLADKLLEFAADYNMPQLEWTSFVRIVGYQKQVAASDVSYAVSALLEHVQDSHHDEHKNDDEAYHHERMVRAFNTALDTLNFSSNQDNHHNAGLTTGIRRAMALQHNILATASSLMERNAITRLSHFRYAYITATTTTTTTTTTTSTTTTVDHGPDPVFTKPLALTRLAYYLMDLHRQTGQWTGTKSRPLILLAEHPRADAFVCVGYEYPDVAGDMIPNRFGKNFALAAQSMDGTFSLGYGWDTNVIQVAARDAQRFLEQLHYLMDSVPA